MSSIYNGKGKPFFAKHFFLLISRNLSSENFIIWFWSCFIFGVLFEVLWFAFSFELSLKAILVCLTIFWLLIFHLLIWFIVLLLFDVMSEEFFDYGRHTFVQFQHFFFIFEGGHTVGHLVILGPHFLKSGHNSTSLIPVHRSWPNHNIIYRRGLVWMILRAQIRLLLVKGRSNALFVEF